MGESERCKRYKLTFSGERKIKMDRNCKDCVNCDFVRGFMCTCHYSYDEMRDGTMFHVQVGQDVHRSKANKCEHYSVEKYGRDTIFVL